MEWNPSGRKDCDRENNNSRSKHEFRRSIVVAVIVTSISFVWLASNLNQCLRYARKFDQDNLTSAALLCFVPATSPATGVRILFVQSQKDDSHAISSS